MKALFNMLRGRESNIRSSHLVYNSWFIYNRNQNGWILWIMNMHDYMHECARRILRHTKSALDRHWKHCLIAWLQVLDSPWLFHFIFSPVGDESALPLATYYIKNSMTHTRKYSTTPYIYKQCRHNIVYTGDVHTDIIIHSTHYCTRG